MKAFRIAWISFLEDETALEGRSLVYAENENIALEKFLKEKSDEFNIHPYSIQIVSFTEITQLSLKEKGDS